MNYELAKELKERGYPFIRIENGMKNGMKIGRHEYFDFNPEGSEEIGAQHFFAPTLSELIKACGAIFHGVHKLQDDGWISFIFDIEDSTRQLETKGGTPEEAVARLWLALHGIVK